MFGLCCRQSSWLPDAKTLKTLSLFKHPRQEDENATKPLTFATEILMLAAGFVYLPPKHIIQGCDRTLCLLGFRHQPCVWSWLLPPRDVTVERLKERVSLRSTAAHLTSLERVISQFGEKIIKLAKLCVDSCDIVSPLKQCEIPSP